MYIYIYYIYICICVYYASAGALLDDVGARELVEVSPLLGGNRY